MSSVALAAFLGALVGCAIFAAAPVIATAITSWHPISPQPAPTWCHHIPVRLDNGTTIQAPICGYWSQNP